MGAYLDRIDAAPDAEKWPLVRQLMLNERQPFFAELRAERPVMDLPDDHGACRRCCSTPVAS